MVSVETYASIAMSDTRTRSRLNDAILEIFIRVGMKSLFDTVAEFISGDWGGDSEGDTFSKSAHCIRAADIVPIETHDFTTIPARHLTNHSFSIRKLQIGDIVIEKSGGSPTQSTGRVIYVSKSLINEKPSLVCSNFCVAIRLKPDWSPYFVYHYWRQIYNTGVFFNYEGKTSGLKNLQLEVAMKSIPIPEIDLQTQLRIAGVICKWAFHLYFFLAKSSFDSSPSIVRSSLAPFAFKPERRVLNPEIFSLNSAAVIGTYSIFTSKYCPAESV